MKSLPMSSKSGGKAPQCRVCGDESSGFHYGVDSCEGCKGFFRRCITQGMNHKCANEEKCEITPFTRNSCQYCRLKKCFEVGMSREASRLGRRPKRLKEVGGDGSGGSRSHAGNVPIAPYPSQQDLYKMRMAELQKILHNNGTFKEDLMQAFLTAAKASFQEHSKTGVGSSGSGEGQGKVQAASSHQQQLMSLQGLGGLNQSQVSSSTSEMPSASSVDSVGMGGSMDSPASLHSPGGSMIDLSNLAALDNFLFEQGMPSTPGGSQQAGLDVVGDLQVANSPFNLSNVSLDPVSSATSPLSDLCAASPVPLPPATAGLSSVNDMLSSNGMNDLLNQNTPSTSGVATSAPPPHTVLQQYQQYQLQQQQQQQQQTAGSSAMADNVRNLQVKTEPVASSCMDPVYVKTEPISPEPLPSTPAAASSVTPPVPKCKAEPIDTRVVTAEINVAAIMEEVKQTPHESRRHLIKEVTDAVVEAHLSTTVSTSKAIEEANRRLGFYPGADPMPDLNRLTLDPNDIWQKFISVMVPEITSVVKFCKKLPGFVEIEQEDQIVLIKQGAFEVMMTRFSMLVDYDNQTMMDPALSTRFPRKVIRELPMGEFLDEFFFVASQFNPLKLTDGELGLFTSILILCPDRRGLANAHAIKILQSLFQQALYFLMKRNHSDPDLKFSQLMSIITTFHRINEEHFKALNSIRMDSSKKLHSHFPDLHREIFDS